MPTRETQQPAGRPKATTLPRLRLNWDKQKGKFARALLAGIASGVFTALAFPPADLGPLAFFALIPLATVFRRSRGWLIAVAAFGFGVAFFGILLSWILLFGWAAIISLVLLQTAWVVVILVASIAVRDGLPSSLKVMAFPVGIVAAEFLRAHLPLTGFTWGGLGYSQHDATGILRVASYTGVWGVSFLVALTGALLAEGLTELRRSPRKAIGLAALGVVVAFAPLALSVPKTSGPAARVAAIQGNQPENLGSPGGDDLSILESHVDLTRRLINEDLSLIVWPEGAAGSDPLDRPELRARVTTTIAETAVPFLVGARIEVDDEHFRNRSLFFDAEGRPIAHYDKIRLVPFGEFVPGRRFLVPIFEQLERVPKDGIPGTRMTLFEISEGAFGSVICFESTFPDLVGELVNKGAGFVAVITDNGSFERTAASRQHLMFSQLRAAENRVWIVHAALSGISGFVAPDGRVVSESELFEPASLVETIRFANRQTIYTRWGDWFPVACVAVLGLFLVVHASRRARRKSPSVQPSGEGTDLG